MLLVRPELVHRVGDAKGILFAVPYGQQEAQLGLCREQRYIFMTCDATPAERTIFHLQDRVILTLATIIRPIACASVHPRSSSQAGGGGMRVILRVWGMAATRASSGYIRRRGPFAARAPAHGWVTISRFQPRITSRDSNHGGHGAFAILTPRS